MVFESVFYEVTKSLLRNVNRQFVNISFDIINNEITLMFILKQKGDKELELIYEIVSELTAGLGEDLVEKPEIFIEKEAPIPLKHVVYQNV